MVEIQDHGGNGLRTHTGPGSTPIEGEDAVHLAHALRLARAAGRRGEVPIGAVAVSEGVVVGAASNRVERSQDATAHAEILALRQASRRLRSWRLSGVTLYSTLEPCPMCAGAILLGRVRRCVYAATDPRKGAHRSAYNVLGSSAGNHHPAIDQGQRAAQAGLLLQEFFRSRRQHPEMVQSTSARPG